MLHYAASKGDLTVVKALIAENADKNKIDQYKFNAYGLAMREEHFQVGLHLLEMPSFTFYDPFKGSGTFGSLLHLAVAKLQVEHVKIMLQHDITTCLVDELSGDTPLHVLMTVYHKRPAEAKELL